jgi:hypothetical protein
MSSQRPDSIHLSAPFVAQMRKRLLQGHAGQGKYSTDDCSIQRHVSEYARK